MEFQTKTIHAGLEPDPATGALITPIHQSAIFVFDDVGKNKGYDYSRSGNPTRKALENHLAELEGGRYGVALATGMSAVLMALYVFRHGDHLICGNDVYGGTVRLLNLMQRQFGFEVSFVPMHDTRQVLEAIRPNTRGLWIETPSNPLFNVVDLEAMVDICQQHKLISIVDNTLLSPYFQQPLRFGVDIVVHSTTKYLCGHNDGLGGVVICNDETLAEQIAFTANATGCISSSFDAWLILRGTKTLALRMREHQKNAFKLVEVLERHPLVKRIYYPGLVYHPKAAVTKKQATGHGGMLSFEVKGGFETARTILKQTRLFHLAESFGGTESLIEHPQTMSHASMDPEAQKAAGITTGLLRVSTGLEAADDLATDLKETLDSVGRAEVSVPQFVETPTPEFA